MIKKEVEIIEKNGINYEKITFIEVGEDGTEIVRGVVEFPVQTEPEAPQPSQLDRIEETVNAIANSENSEAINALLGG